jgi:hypothetical protein
MRAFARAARFSLCAHRRVQRSRGSILLSRSTRKDGAACAQTLKTRTMMTSPLARAEPLAEALALVGQTRKQMVRRFVCLFPLRTRSNTSCIHVCGHVCMDSIYAHVQSATLLKKCTSSRSRHARNSISSTHCHGRALTAAPALPDTGSATASQMRRVSTVDYHNSTLCSSTNLCSAHLYQSLFGTRYGGRTKSLQSGLPQEHALQLERRGRAEHTEGHHRDAQRPVSRRGREISGRVASSV